jgi:hypothetical protein
MSCKKHIGINMMVAVISIKPRSLHRPFKLSQLWRKKLKEINDSVQKINESLQALSQAFEKFGQVVEEFVKTQQGAPKARKAKPAKKKAEISTKVAKTRKAKPKAKKKAPTAKPAKVTATAAVLDIIKGAEGGASVVFIKEKTGFNDKQVSNCVYRLKKQGVIKSTGRGVYTIA